MAQRPSFDMSRLSPGTMILGGASFLYFIDLFLPWQKLGELKASGVDGVGVINLLLVVLILVLELVLITNAKVNVGTPESRNQVVAGAAGGVLLFTIIKLAVDNDFLHFWAWIGLVLAVVIAFGGYLKWQESQAVPPPPPPGGSGFTP